MFNLCNFVGELENEIVFSVCDMRLCNNLFTFLKRNEYHMREKRQESSGDEMFVFANKNKQVLINICHQADAIFIYLKESDVLISNYLQKCPRCNSDNIVEKIPYWHITNTNFEQVEQGKLEFLPGAYDRHGVPVPNWMCRECKLEWHNKEDLRRRYMNVN